MTHPNSIKHKILLPLLLLLLINVIIIITIIIIIISIIETFLNSSRPQGS